MKLNRYTVYKGQHVFQLWGRVWEPPCISKDVVQMTWEAKFGDGADYVLPYPDSRDWNKGGGRSFDMLTNHRDSVMWGWRANNEKGGHDLCMYCHVDGMQVIGTEHIRFIDPEDAEVMLFVPKGDSCTISVKLDAVHKRYKMSMRCGQEANYCEIPFTHDKRWSRSIGAWFGGRNHNTKRPNPAPQKMDLYIGKSFR